jgi:hypothetical protein
VSQLLVRLFERHEHARLVELGSSTHQEFHGQDSLAAARRAAQKRRPPFGQTATGDLVQADDAGWAFLNSISWGEL